MLTQTEYETEYTNYFDATIRFVNKLTCNNRLLPIGSTEDIAQMAWLRAWEKRAQFEGRSNAKFHTWVHRIAFTAYIQYAVRDKHLHKEAPILGEHATTQAERATQCNIVTRELMSRLNPEERIIVQLRYFYGYTHEELAEFLDVGVGALKTVLNRALETMRGNRNSTPHWTPRRI